MLKWRVHGLRWRDMRIKTKTRHSCTNIQSKHNDNHAVSQYEAGIVYAESAITYVGTEGGR